MLQSIASQMVVISFIFMTLTFDSRVTLFGEIIRQKLAGVKGLILYIQTSVFIFSLLFSVHLQRC